MNWVPLVLGLIIGWLLYMLADYFFGATVAFVPMRKLVYKNRLSVWSARPPI